MWIIYLYGDDVYQGISIRGYVDDADKIDDAVKKVADTINIEFYLDEKFVGLRRYANATDNRKVWLIAELVDKLA